MDGAFLLATDVSVGPVEGGLVGTVVAGLLAVVTWLLKDRTARDRQWLDLQSQSNARHDEAVGKAIEAAREVGAANAASQAKLADAVQTLGAQVQRSAAVSEATMRVLAMAKGGDPNVVDDVVRAVVDRLRSP